jgi:peptidyl-prolyl cis-trans isomerase A (cyclophilin A)
MSKTKTQRCGAARWPWRLALPLTLALTACGGGDPATRVSSLSASGNFYGQSLTVTANGSGLDAEGLKLETEGVTCRAARRSSTQEWAASFTCQVEGVGPLTAVIRDAQGAELGRVHTSVAIPRVRVTAAQGTVSGSFDLELDPHAAPITALNFMRYVNTRFYTDTIFHRVLAGELVQGGQYLTDKKLKTALFDPIKLESNNGLKNLRGTVAMARTVVSNSASAQFYINLRDNPAFDYKDEASPGYAVFGHVIAGMDKVDLIGGVPIYTFNAGLYSVPVNDVVIKSVVQIQ